MSNKKQRRLIAKGELGYIPAKHIVSALPEEGERPANTHKKVTVDGWEREDEEEVRSHPTSRRQLERLHMTFRTTLLMRTAALPQFGNLKVTKELHAPQLWPIHFRLPLCANAIGCVWQLGVTYPFTPSNRLTPVD